MHISYEAYFYLQKKTLIGQFVMYSIYLFINVYSITISIVWKLQRKEMKVKLSFFIK